MSDYDDGVLVGTKGDLPDEKRFFPGSSRYGMEDFMASFTEDSPDKRKPQYTFPNHVEPYRNDQGGDSNLQIMMFDDGHTEYHNGYMIGLAQFMLVNGLVREGNLFVTGLDTRVEFELFSKGMRLEAPGIPDELEDVFSERFGIPNERITNIDYDGSVQVPRGRQRSAYQKGFLVGAFKSHGIKLEEHELPFSDRTYIALIQGINAEIRPAPEVEPIDEVAFFLENFIIKQVLESGLNTFLHMMLM